MSGVRFGSERFFGVSRCRRRGRFFRGGFVFCFVVVGFVIRGIRAEGLNFVIFVFGVI